MKDMDSIHSPLGMEQIHEILHKFTLESWIKRITSFESHMDLLIDLIPPWDWM
jgi:hypothetical protein